MRTMTVSGLTKWVVIMVAFGVTSSAWSANSLTLAREGKPTATIVIAQDATRAAQLAAYELQYHVQKITGAELPIVRDDVLVSGARVLVGESRATQTLGLPGKEFGLQEYLIRFLPDALVLMGKDKEDREEVKYDLIKYPDAVTTWPSIWDEQGTMYAVYDFLERVCDVRWYNPTEAGMECPEMKTLTVKGGNLRRAPRFRYRYACYLVSEQYENFTSLQPQDPETWKRYEAAAYPELHRRFSDPNQYNIAKRGWVQLFRFRRRDGGELCPGNHSLYGYYNRFWEKNADPDAAKLFEGRKPDWFAQGYEGTPPQMCYTNRGLIEQVAQDARDFFDGKGMKPGAQAAGDFFCVEPMDNSQFCKCSQCQELIQRIHSEGASDVYSTGQHSDYFFNFVNDVAKEVRKTHPDKWIVTLAYMTHALPPKTFTLEPNVLVQFCFASNRMVYATKDYANDLNALHAWADEAKKSKRPLYLWLYYTFPVEIAVNGKFHCFPGYFAHTIGEQFKLFDKLGYRGMFHCGYGQEVEAYVTYRLMDDPALIVDKLLNEYFARYYGAAAEPMKRLYLDIEKTYCNPANYPERPGHQNVKIAWGRLGTDERMAEYARLMQQAQDLAVTYTAKRRVELFKLGTWDYMSQGHTQYTSRMKAPMPSIKAPRVQAADGNAANVDWSKAAALGGTWFDRGQDKPAARKLSGRVAHDGKYLYLELTDPCDTKKLVTASMVFPCDDWEIFIAGQRGLPYRQYAVGPSGHMVALSHGEVNWRMNVEMTDHGIIAEPDVSASDRWVTRLVIPLSNLVKDGVTPGGKFYMNVVRVSSPGIGNTPGLGIDTWVSFCTVHDVDRLGEITLE